MCRELTVISIFLMGLLADFLLFQINPLWGSAFYLQIGIALFLLIIISLVGKRFLARRFSLSLKFLPVWILKWCRLGFRPDFWKRQTPLPRV